MERKQFDEIENDRRLLGLGIWNPPVDNSEDTARLSKKERSKNKPGKFWARSSAGVYLNNTYVRRHGR